MNADRPLNGSDYLMLGFDHELRRHGFAGNACQIVLEGGETNLDGVRAFCREHLAPYKIPARLHVVAALPRTAVTGKIRREAVTA